MLSSRINLATFPIREVGRKVGNVGSIDNSNETSLQITKVVESPLIVHSCNNIMPLYQMDIASPRYHPCPTFLNSSYGFMLQPANYIDVSGTREEARENRRYSNA